MGTPFFLFLGRPGEFFFWFVTGKTDIFLRFGTCKIDTFLMTWDRKDRYYFFAKTGTDQQKKILLEGGGGGGMGLMSLGFISLDSYSKFGRQINTECGEESSCLAKMLYIIQGNNFNHSASRGKHPAQGHSTG